MMIICCNVADFPLYKGPRQGQDTTRWPCSRFVSACRFMHYQGVQDRAWVLYLRAEQTWKWNHRCRCNYEGRNFSSVIRVLRRVWNKSFQFFNVKDGGYVNFNFFLSRLGATYFVFLSSGYKEHRLWPPLSEVFAGSDGESNKKRVVTLCDA